MSETNQSENILSFAFYNLENLYDVLDDPNTEDEEFTPYGKLHWNSDRYKNKINNLGEVISQIGLEQANTPPMIVGVAEVENDLVLNDLVQNEHLEPFHYGYVHYDSADERGIDVALLYQKQHFEIVNQNRYPVVYEYETGEKDFSRDILAVEGKYKNESILVIVNHWFSRREGITISDKKRLVNARVVNEIIAQNRALNPDIKIVVMGDFNDEPLDRSVKNIVKVSNLHNMMQNLKEQNQGSLFAQGKWFLFDQILVSHNFFDKANGGLIIKNAEIFNPKFIKTWKGRRKNTPYRTFIGQWHQGGFSDHFPVLVYLEHLSLNQEKE